MMDETKPIFPKNWNESKRKMKGWASPETQENICPNCHRYGGRLKHDGVCQFCGYQVEIKFEAFGVKVIKYNHHGNDVFVMKDNKGRHRESCLCWMCGKFYLETQSENCPIAKLLYNVCVLLKLVTPVWECPVWIRPRADQFDEKEEPCEEDTEFGKAMMPDKGK